jgi:hypothetical protein
MGRHLSVLSVVLPLFLLAAACEHKQSSNPLSPSLAGPIAGVSVDVPKPVQPAPSSQIAVEQQPISFLFENAATNGPRPLGYIFEISTDASFSTKVFTQTVEAGQNGNTTVKLPQSLSPEKKYYWRVKADDGANASDYSSPVEFVVYTPVVIQAPALNEPAEGKLGVVRKPTFSVTNAQRSGPAGAIQYFFEVATDPAFSAKVASALVNEGSGQTTYTVPDDLSYSTVYYWRVKAMDPSHESPRSQTRVFTTLAAPVVAPTNPGGPIIVPNPNDAINPNGATFYNNPSGIGSWPQTATITSVEFNGSGMLVDFDRRTGPNKWPELTSPDGFGPLQYTLGLCYRLSGSWHCSAAIQFWDSRPLSESGPWQQIPDNWYYDSWRWGPMAGYRPSRGELVMVFAGQGNLRGSGGGTRMERTNFAPVLWGEGLK